MGDAFESSLEVDVLAAALRMDAQESGDLLEFLAQKLELSLPQNTAVVRGGNFLTKKKPVKEITVRFSEAHYQIVREPHGPPSAKVLKLVRGVVLKTTEVSLDQWTEEIAQHLAQLAQQSAQTRSALNKFILGS